MRDEHRCRWKLSQRLWRDDGASAKLAQQGADSIAAGRVTPPAAPPAGTPPADPLAKAMEVKKDVQAVQALPIGWPSPRFEGASGKSVGAFLAALAFALMGWIVTAFASSLGAPFWFDGIGWLLALRGTGAKPPAETAPVVVETLKLPAAVKSGVRADNWTRALP